MRMDDENIKKIVENVLRELISDGTISAVQPDRAGAPINQPEPSNVPTLESLVLQHPESPINRPGEEINIDLPDPTIDEMRYKPRVDNPKDHAALSELIASTSARIGVGRAGPRYKTASQLLFQGDHAVTQDAIYRDIDQNLLDKYNLFTVQTNITGGKEEYLLHPDLGRQLNDEAKRTIAEKCIQNPKIQLVVGDGLSTAAIEANLGSIFPVIKQGIQATGLSFGTPFYVEYCRVGVMNDIGEAIKPDVLILLIGERPGLGRAESMSAYMGYKPKQGKNDADRDVVCNIFEHGGTNPLEAGAFIVQLAQKMLKYEASGVKLKLATK
jgi:ethanolamine ammonia-lyase small subunit